LQRTVLAQPVVNVTKAGNKLGLHIPNLSVTNEMSRVVRITIRSDSGTASFLAKTSKWICIPSRIRSTLGIEDDQRLRIVELETIQPHTPRPLAIVGNKVDMLSLIPETTNRGYQLYVDYEDQEPRLRIWYYHERGAAQQIELKRYVGITKLGQLLGLLQAEGDKTYSRVAFKNASICEHADFVSALHDLGLSTRISASCTFNPKKSSFENLLEYSKAYEEATGIAFSTYDKMTDMKGAIAAYTHVRSTILANILFFAIDGVCSGSFQNQNLRQNFLAKLLTGDGTLDARKTARRLDVRVTIVDANTESLRDYAAILLREGFKAHVHRERICVRAYCTWLNLLKLYQIGAFRTNKNWIKLLCAIVIALKGTQNQGYRRIQELSNLRRITSNDVCTRYRIGRRAANLWIVTMQELGLMQKLSERAPGNYNGYVVTRRGREISELLDAIGRDYHKICLERQSEDSPESILKEIKVKGKFRSTEQRAEAG